MYAYNRSPDKVLRDCYALQRDVAKRKHVTRNLGMGQVCVPQTPSGAFLGHVYWFNEIPFAIR